MYRKIEKCRICGNTDLKLVLDLGHQMLTGVFPKIKGDSVTTGPLRLVKCSGPGVCGLLQLEHSYNPTEIYGNNYGYRSGLNASMVAHLHGKVKRILERVTPRAGDLVIDIGSNDSTTLQAYFIEGLVLVGIDPTGLKFHKYYPPRIRLIPDFFSSALLQTHFPGKKAKIITSFAMFYDLEDPLSFMREIYDVLAEDGVWVFEQSYMPTMLEVNAYDTVCHEHLEFYALHQIKWMADRVGFEILDVELNPVNGGSFSVTVAKSKSHLAPSASVQIILEDELKKGLHTLAPYEAFAKCAEKSKRDLKEFIALANAQGKSVAALGASTKGNVLLQYCGLTEKDICCIGEVNEDKYGCYTPGTWIPIIPEKELLAKKPDYLIVLPWHFKEFFESLDQLRDIALVYPLPELHLSPPPT
jgi:NDP-4-keto-2,6-dideoxyhexose 3-C-methyltransferase